MAKRTVISDATIKRNKRVDVTVVKEARRIRKELDKLGAGRAKGYRLVHPLDGKILTNQQGRRNRTVSQTS